MSDLIKNLLVWTVIAVVILSLFTGMNGRNNASDEYNYSEFMQQVQTGQVEEVTIAGREISGTLKSGKSFMTFSPETDNSALVGELLNSKVKISLTIILPKFFLITYHLFQHIYYTNF